MINMKDLTFIQHLEELRKRIIICLISLCVTSMASFPASKLALRILKLPADGMIAKLAYFSPAEAFTTYFKIAVFCGLLLSAPVILYELWCFVAPAVGDRIRKYTVLFVSFSLLAFIAGCLFAYYLLLPAALKFLLSFAQGELEPVISVSKYISFALSIILCTGLVFEMPTISFILSKLGILHYRFLRKYYKYAILAIFIAAAVITPTPDAFNMTLLAIPMLLLYEISIWVSYFTRRHG